MGILSSCTNCDLFRPQLRGPPHSPSPSKTLRSHLPEPTRFASRFTTPVSATQVGFRVRSTELNFADSHRCLHSLWKGPRGCFPHCPRSRGCRYRRVCRRGRHLREARRLCRCSLVCFPFSFAGARRKEHLLTFSAAPPSAGNASSASLARLTSAARSVPLKVRV